MSPQQVGPGDEASEPAKAAGKRRFARIRGALAPALTLALFGAALWAVDHVLNEYHYRDVAHALGQLPGWAVACSLALTVLGYLALVGYDWVALPFAGLSLPFRSMLIPSFVSFAVSNSAPANVLTAGGVRYRLYADK